MTWLFTQVWLWSLAAFVLGSLTTWLLFVLPLQRKLTSLHNGRMQHPDADRRPDADYQPSTALDLFAPEPPALSEPVTPDGAPGVWVPASPGFVPDPEGDTLVARSRSAVATSSPPADATGDAAATREPAVPNRRLEGRLPDVDRPDSDATQRLPRVADGRSPSDDYRIKGHFASRQYHTPDSPQYDRVVAEVWFRTAEDAEQAGFEPWNARPTR